MYFNRTVDIVTVQHNNDNYDDSTLIDTDDFSRIQRLIPT